MKISELIYILQTVVREHGDRQVLCSWESVTPDIASIYLANDKPGCEPGTLLIDSDDGFYQNDFAETVIWERNTRKAQRTATAV